MNQEVYDILVGARVSLLRKKPFFGNLVMNLKLIEMSKEESKQIFGSGIPTACTNGRYIKYSPEYIIELNNMSKGGEYVQSLLVHEVMHCAFSHMQRRNGRLPVRWNFATDYWINASISDPSADDPFPLHKNWLFNKEYIGLTCDEIYDILSDKIDDLIKQGKGTMDHHMDDWDDLTDFEKEALTAYWKDNVASAYFAAGKAGLGSGMLSKYLSELFEPKLKWYDKIRQTVAEYTKTDFSWKIPNRRMFSSGIIMPSMDKQTKVKLAIAVDTSGSIFNEIETFFSEIKGIVSTYTEYEIHIACFDGEVKSPFIIKSESDFETYLSMIEGGGGTNFIAWWDWFYDNKINEKVDTVIFFTDMEPCGDFVRKDHSFDNLYWVAKNSTKEAPVGTTLIYD